MTRGEREVDAVIKIYGGRLGRGECKWRRKRKGVIGVLLE